MKAFTRIPRIRFQLLLAAIAFSLLPGQTALCINVQDILSDTLRVDSLSRSVSPSRGMEEPPPTNLSPKEPQNEDEAIPQEHAQVNTLKWHTMFTKIPSDWALFGKRTFRTESVPAIVGIAGITGAIYVFDQNTYRDTHAYEGKSRKIKTYRDALISVGDGVYQFGFIGTMALYGFASDDSRALRMASQMTEAILATGVVVQVLKRITGRESPIVATEDRGEVRPFPNFNEYERHQPKYYSFPSGHIATTTASLTVLCESYPEATWLRPASIILIGAVAGSLVSKGWHWYSDFPLGIALGYSFGKIAAHPEGLEVKKADENSTTTISVEPVIMAYGAGMAMSVHF